MLNSKIQGMAASVYKCIEKKTNLVRAVKQMRTDDEEKMQAAANEYELLKSLKNKSIIQVYQSYLDTMRNTMYTVMEFVPGSTVQKQVEDNGALEGKNLDSKTRCIEK